MLALYHDIEAAAETVSAMIANRIIPATLEFLDQATVKVVEDFAKIGLPTDAKAVLLIEQDGAPEIVERDVEKIETVGRANGACGETVDDPEGEEEAL